MTPTEFFKPKTGIIASVKPSFKPRAGQQALAELILDSLSKYDASFEDVETGPQTQQVLSEAPTGFGKSFAALVPAIIAAVTKKKRTVISTETIALQDQYVNIDLPMLQAACKAQGLNFSFAVAKGRSNYICKQILEDGYSGAGTLTPLELWANKQEVNVNSGDKASVPFNSTDLEWRKVGAESDCERKGCPSYGEGRQGHSDCFVYTAQRKYLEADIIVTNHSLLLLDAANGMEPGNILGKYDLAIIDEAHTIPEQAQDTWGHEFRPRTVSNMLTFCNRMLRRVGLNHFEHGFLDNYRGLEDAVFDPFTPILKKDAIYLKNVRDSVIYPSKNAANELIDALIGEVKMLKDFQTEDERHQTVIATVREKIGKTIRGLKVIYGDDVDDEYRDNWVTYIEPHFTARNEKYGVLQLRPIDIAPLMRGYVLDKVPSTVFMSATLQVNNSYAFMRKELGIKLDTCVEFTGETPFDFMAQAQGYYPTDLPEPDDDDYFDALCKRIRTIIRRRKGRTLVLFTSADLMRRTHEALKDRVPYHCYVQGEANKNVLLEHFKEDVGSCLFATRSFFAGVDVPGEALSTVILTKAPFRVPNDPLFKAKCQKIKDQGRDDFSSYSLPLCLMDVRQAFGRLIRSVDDEGMFCFLDSRANKKPYGKRIKDSLPRMKIVSVVEEVEE